MGYAISWLAVKGKPEEVLIAELGLVPTGEMAEYSDSMFTGRMLPSGWFLLVIDKSEHKLVKPNSLAPLSQGCEVIASSIEEHVMVCSSELWRDGAQVWRIEHDAQKSIEHIAASGNPPAGYSAIEQEHAEEQKKAGGSEADVDYFFEIPLHTAKNIVGFKHDEVDPAIEDESFMVFELEAARARERIGNQGKKPWWKLW
jgi:hypothetical protein